MRIPTLRRGVIFRAEHDASFDFWGSEAPRWKLGLAFNAEPPTPSEDVLYFLATSKVSKFRETPSILSDTLIFPVGAYSFFPDETLIDFRTLCAAPLYKLLRKGLSVKGELTAADIQKCVEVVSAARILPNRAKKLLGLR